jgi:ATP-dependent Clp protease, protease subunit
MSAPVFSIRGYIGEGRNTSASVSGFLAMHAGEAVDIIVNSPGGDALEGAAILAEIEAHGRARCIVRGVAASSASLLICGASKIVMHRAAYMMLHLPWTMTVGDSEAHRKAAELLEKVGRTDAEVYATSSGQPLSRVKTWLAQELWSDRGIGAGGKPCQARLQRPQRCAFGLDAPRAGERMGGRTAQIKDGDEQCLTTPTSLRRGCLRAFV